MDAEEIDAMSRSRFLLRVSFVTLSLLLVSVRTLYPGVSVVSDLKRVAVFVKVNFCFSSPKSSKIFAATLGILTDQSSLREFEKERLCCYAPLRVAPADDYSFRVGCRRL